MMMEAFERDDAENRSNIRKRGIGFDAAKRIFLGVVVTEIDGRRKGYGETRYCGIGAARGGIVVVAHTRRNGRIRLISARPASRKERRKYHEKT